MKKHKSIQKKLFTNYFVLILVVVFVFLAVVFSYILNIVSDNASQSMNQKAESIKSELEMEIDTANALQKRILFSKGFETALFSEAEKYQDDVEALKLQRELNELTDTVCGPEEYWNFQMNYWNSNGGCAGVGYNTFIAYSPGKIEGLEGFDKIVSGNGKKVISPVYTTEWYSEAIDVISMYRLMKKVGAKEYVIIETQIRARNLYDIIEKNLGVSEDGAQEYHALITNADGDVIYASEDIRDSEDTYVNMLEGYKANSTLNSMAPSEHTEGQIFTGTYSNFLDWNIWVMETQDAYIEPFIELGFTILALAAGVVVLLWIVTYTLTKQLVKPILAIHKKMSELDLNRLDTGDRREIQSDIKELTELNGTFNQMCRQLDESRQKLELAHENEVQARFLAMQAQMNPHFLYNILSIIKIMGKDVKSQSIVDVCTELSMMLRYISTSDRSAVTMKQEVQHTLNYLKLMKTRFQDRLEYEINIPSYMDEIHVPRLILQPLAENSMKYATEGRPPWRLIIRGWCKEKKWFLEIRDNGPGIQEDKKAELEEKMQEELIGEYTSSTEIGGMGILNIYARLILVYGREGYFKLFNYPEGGLSVTIGGTIDE